MSKRWTTKVNGSRIITAKSSAWMWLFKSNCNLKRTVSINLLLQGFDICCRYFEDRYSPATVRYEELAIC